MPNYHWTKCCQSLGEVFNSNKFYIAVKSIIVDCQIESETQT